MKKIKMKSEGTIRNTLTTYKKIKNKSPSDIIIETTLLWVLGENNGKSLESSLAYYLDNKPELGKKKKTSSLKLERTIKK